MASPLRARIPLFLPSSLLLRIIRSGTSKIELSPQKHDIFTFDEQVEILGAIKGVSSVTKSQGESAPTLKLAHFAYYHSRALLAKNAYNRAIKGGPLFDVEAKTKPEPISITDKYLIPSVADFAVVRSRKRISAKKTVYVSGSFDILNPGCLRFLQSAKSKGSQLVVGLPSDFEITKILSMNSRLLSGLKPFKPFLTAVPSDNPFPIFSLQERAINLMSLDVVDDVIMEVPPTPTREMLERLNIDVLAMDGRDHGALWRNEDDSPEFEGEVVRIENQGDLNENDVLQRVQ